MPHGHPSPEVVWLFFTLRSNPIPSRSPVLFRPLQTSNSPEMRYGSARLNTLELEAAALFERNSRHTRRSQSWVSPDLVSVIRRHPTFVRAVYLHQMRQPPLGLRLPGTMPLVRLREQIVTTGHSPASPVFDTRGGAVAGLGHQEEATYAVCLVLPAGGLTSIHPSIHLSIELVSVGRGEVMPTSRS